MLGGSQEPLVAAYDLVMFDLDGVVYLGDAPVPGAPGHLRQVRETGAHVAFVTNNASRPPEVVAEKLRAMEVAADAGDVVTSAQAAARMLRERLADGSRVAVLGAAGLEEALRAEALVPVAVDDPEAAAIVSGYGPEVSWRTVMQAAVRIRDGLPWVASNTDLTIPTGFGTAPGHGVMVRMLSDFAAVEPEVAGKPARPLLDETVRRVGGRRPLMVGDRLDTDIEGAREAGLDSLLVMTGVTGLPELVAAPPRLRPTYVADDLAGLFAPHPVPADEGEGRWSCGGWTAWVEGGSLRWRGEGSASDRWRALASAGWTHLDAVGEVPRTDGGSLAP